jgi:medium-chain acyl-[acyl-carrier-protein] hydrolase
MVSMRAEIARQRPDASVQYDPQLFCLPYAGASFYAYNSIFKALPTSITATTLDLPGHGRRLQEPLLFDIETMTLDLLPILRRQIQGPFALFGHSLGALLAWHLACRLYEAGDPLPCHLFVSGRGGPCILPEEGDIDSLSQEAFLRRIADYGGTPAALLQQADFMEFLEPILRADFTAVAGYRHREWPALPLPVTVLLGTGDRFGAPEAAAWQKTTTMRADVAWFSGGHFFLFDNIPAVSRLITRRIEAETASDSKDGA